LLTFCEKLSHCEPQCFKENGKRENKDTRNSRYTRGLRSCESLRVSKTPKTGKITCPWIFCVMRHKGPKFVLPGVKMVGRATETARITQWACAASSTVAADGILMLLIILKLNRGDAKTCITRGACTRIFLHIVVILFLTLCVAVRNFLSL
jgi:hypothetical protein